VEVRGLDWKSLASQETDWDSWLGGKPSPSLVLGADIVRSSLPSPPPPICATDHFWQIYDPHLVPPLIGTLVQILTSESHVALIAMIIRNPETYNAFSSLAGELGSVPVYSILFFI
jgi:hypothetical protein